MPRGLDARPERLIDLVANSHQDDEDFKDTAQLVPDSYYFEAVNKGYLNDVSTPHNLWVVGGDSYGYVVG